MTHTQAQIAAALSAYAAEITKIYDQGKSLTIEHRRIAMTAALTAAAEVGYVNVGKPPGGQRHPPGTCQECDNAAAAEVGPCALEDMGKKRCVEKCEWYAAEVGEQYKNWIAKRADIRNSAIERCAQVVDNIAEQHDSKFESEAYAKRILQAAAAAIRGLKEEGK